MSKNGNKSIKIDYDNLTPEISNCDTIHKTNLGDPEDDSLPIYFGYNSKTEEFALQIGNKTDSLIMNKVEYAFFMASLAKLSNEGLRESFNMSVDDFIVKQITINDVKLSYGCNKVTKSEDKLEGTSENKELSSEELETFLDLTIKKAKADSSEEPIDSNEYEQLKEQLADFEKIYTNLSEEEKEKVEKQMALRREQLLEEKAKKFEETLLGEIEQEEKVEYTYEYFKKVYDEKGPEFMREELAKIPKSERSIIIKKIVAEAEQEQLNKIN